MDREFTSLARPNSFDGGELAKVFITLRLIIDLALLC